VAGPSPINGLILFTAPSNRSGKSTSAIEKYFGSGLRVLAKSGDLAFLAATSAALLEASSL
jgi:hypothetical protein